MLYELISTDLFFDVAKMRLSASWKRLDIWRLRDDSNECVFVDANLNTIEPD